MGCKGKKDSIAWEVVPAVTNPDGTVREAASIRPLGRCKFGQRHRFSAHSLPLTHRHESCTRCNKPLAGSPQRKPAPSHSHGRLAMSH